MLKARIEELAANPWLLSTVLFGVFTVASLAQLVVGALNRPLSAEEHLPADPDRPGAAVRARRYAEGWRWSG